MDHSTIWIEASHPKGVVENSRDQPLSPEEMVARFPAPEQPGDRVVRLYESDKGCGLIGAYLRNLNAPNILVWVDLKIALGDRSVQAASASPLTDNLKTCREELKLSMIRLELADKVNARYYGFQIKEGDTYPVPPHPLCPKE